MSVKNNRRARPVSGTKSAFSGLAEMVGFNSESKRKSSALQPEEPSVPTSEETPRFDESVLLDPIEEPTAIEEPIVPQAPEVPAEPVVEEPEVLIVEEPVVEEPVVVTPVTPVEEAPMFDYSNTSKSLFAKDIEIHGDIVSAGDLEVLGTVMGNVAVKGELLIKGTLMGNIEAAELTLDGGNVVAENIMVEGNVSTVNGAVVEGNIQGANVVVSGKITGNIVATEVCTIESAAQIAGDIKAGALSVAQGASLQGRLEIAPAN